MLNFFELVSYNRLAVTSHNAPHTLQPASAGSNRHFFVLFACPCEIINCLTKLKK